MLWSVPGRTTRPNDLVTLVTSAADSDTRARWAAMTGARHGAFARSSPRGFRADLADGNSPARMASRPERASPPPRADALEDLSGRGASGRPVSFTTVSPGSRACSVRGPSEDRREHRKDSSLVIAVVQQNRQARTADGRCQEPGGARVRASPRWVRGDELDESTQPSSNAPIDGRQAECASAIGSHWTDLNPDRLRARWRPQRLLSAVATNGIRLDAGSGRGVPRRCVA